MANSNSLVLKKNYFNSYTPTGKMNCVLATYSDIALLVLYFKVRKTKQQTIAKIPNQKPLNQPTKQPSSCKITIVDSKTSDLTCYISCLRELMPTHQAILSLYSKLWLWKREERSSQLRVERLGGQEHGLLPDQTLSAGKPVLNNTFSNPFWIQPFMSLKGKSQDPLTSQKSTSQHSYIAYQGSSIWNSYGEGGAYSNQNSLLNQSLLPGLQMHTGLGQRLSRLGPSWDEGE